MAFIKATEEIKIEEIRVEDVLKVYSGKNGKCMCGCAGKYTYRKTTQEIGGEKRGYPVTDDEVSDRAVKTILNKINAGIREGLAERESDHIAVVVDKRIYVAYLLPSAAEWLVDSERH
jgi:hypothetical protein